MRLKVDADEIETFMRQLADRGSLAPNRQWWPNWLYRSDHVENAAEILNSGELISRAAAEAQGLIKVDSGSPGHIGQLTEEQRTYVRLYFRPRAPTQYANEGIRPRAKIEYGAHMPVPVYMLFSSSLLKEEGVMFSKGRLDPTAQVGETADFLKSMSFDDIYHDQAVPRMGESERRASILNARHSEVLVRDRLSLSCLRHVVCRSAPERETLVNLLKPKSLGRWKERIHVDEGHRRLFHKRGTFVQRADLSISESRFTFYSNIPSDMLEPFELSINWLVNGEVQGAIKKDFVVSGTPVAYSLTQRWSDYRVKVFLNGDLAYIGDFDEEISSDILF